MKITVELDPTPTQTPKSVTTSAPAATPAPAISTRIISPEPRAPEPKSTQPAAGKRDAVLQEIEKQPKASEEKPSQPAASYSSGNFAHQGGIMDIRDPDREKPGVFKFVAPEEEQA